MEVYNLINKNTGKPVVNQIVIIDGNNRTFQSYKTTIAKKIDGGVFLNNSLVDYVGMDNQEHCEEAYKASRTTLKYLYQFLGIENRKELDNKINNGEYELINNL